MSTPEYIRRSQNKYNSKFDIIQIKAPKGTKERITAVSGQSMAAFCLQCVLDRLDELESLQEPGNAKEQEPAEQANDWDYINKVLEEKRKENEARKAEAAQVAKDPEPEEEQPEQAGLTAAKMLDIIRGGGSLPEDPEKEAVRAASKNQESTEN